MTTETNLAVFYSCFIHHMRTKMVRDRKITKTSFFRNFGGIFLRSFVGAGSPPLPMAKSQVWLSIHVHRTVNRLKWFKKTIEKPNDIETSEINCKKLTTFSGLLTVSIFVKFPI